MRSAQAARVDGLPNGAPDSRSMTSPMLASSPGAGDTSTPRNRQPARRAISSAASTTTPIAASIASTNAPRASSGSRPPSTIARRSGGDSRPMLKVRGSVNQADGKKGVPEGTNAAAAKRKFPSPPGVPRPIAAIASAADEIALRWMPVAAEATRTEKLVFAVRWTASAAQGPNRASYSSPVMTGPTLNAASASTMAASRAARESSPAEVDQSGRYSANGCVATRIVWTSQASDRR